MFRRTLMIFALALAAAGLIAPGVAGASRSGSPAVKAAANGKTNVLFIMMDDARPDALQYMPKARQWFGSQGTTFIHTTTANPNCCPARSAFFSGQYPHNNGVLRQKDAKKLNEAHTIQAYLQNAGYQTAISGKFLTSWPARQAPPHFNKYTYIKGGYYNYNADVDGKMKKLGSTDAAYSTNYLTSQMMKYLDGFTKAGKPWYGYLAYQAPHMTTGSGDGGNQPATPEKKYANANVGNCVAPRETNKSDKPPYLKHWNVGVPYIDQLCTAAARTLLTVDDQIDVLMKHLQATGQLNNTIAFLASDNGFLDGEHNAIKKFQAYGPSTGVPLLMRWPGHVAAGVNDGRNVSLIDVLPTLVSALGLKPQAPMDGFSLLSSQNRPYNFSEFFQDPSDLKFIPSWATIQTPTWQYTEYYDTSFNITFREYYNLQTDPQELNNLLADKNTKNDPNVAQLHAELTAARNCSGSTCP